MFHRSVLFLYKVINYTSSRMLAYHAVNYLRDQMKENVRRRTLRLGSVRGDNDVSGGGLPHSETE
jgi:hypothetical protein